MTKINVIHFCEHVHSHVYPFLLFKISNNQIYRIYILLHLAHITL